MTAFSHSADRPSGRSRSSEEQPDGTRRPLYQAATRQPASRESAGHAGLWFDKFCDRWRTPDEGADSWDLSGDKNERKSRKLTWIEQVTDCPVGEQDQLDTHALRLTRLVERCGGRIAVFVTESRFVTGLGRSHPVENGFAWHPTLGTPYLPGSSIKGLVLAWAREQAAPRPDCEALARVFGEPGHTGGVCFLDAVPIAPVRLAADVMTPHYGGWGEEDPPGDWRSPNPIPFLITAVDTAFLFGVVPARSTVSGAPGKDLDNVSEWLCAALEWSGGGAKTALGYGRFRKHIDQTGQLRKRLQDEDRQRRRDREQREAMKSPEGRWRLKLEGLSEDQLLDQVRIHLEKEPLEDPRERRVFARAIPGTLVELWRRGDKRDRQTSVGKKKLKERARQIRRALAETDS